MLMDVSHVDGCQSSFLLVQRLIVLPVRENGEYKSGRMSSCILSFKIIYGVDNSRCLAVSFVPF